MKTDMTLPKRKKNRLENFDYGTACAYFITVCVKNRRRILSDIVGDDAHIVPSTYGRVVEKYIRNVPEIEKYCIMPDHIHLLIRIDSESSQTPHTKRVDNIVRSIKILTTKEIGESLFQRSYHDHIIRCQKDYDEIWKYIDNNPRKWRLNNMVD